MGIGEYVQMSGHGSRSFLPCICRHLPAACGLAAPRHPVPCARSAQGGRTLLAHLRKIGSGPNERMRSLPALETAIIRPFFAEKRIGKKNLSLWHPSCSLSFEPNKLDSSEKAFMATVVQERKVSTVEPETNTQGEPAEGLMFSSVERITMLFGLCFFLMLWVLLLLDLVIDF
jgi:hypothetical protein